MIYLFVYFFFSYALHADWKFPDLLSSLSLPNTFPSPRSTPLITFRKEQASQSYQPKMT